MLPAADLFIRIDESGEADWQIADGDIVLDTGLRSTVICSLFSDARKPDAEREKDAADDDPRGVWFDRAGLRYGSLLWLLEREKVSPGIESRTASWTEAALAWLRESGIAKDVDVAVERRMDGQLLINVGIVRSPISGWAETWEAEAAVVQVGGSMLRILAR